MKYLDSINYNLKHNLCPFCVMPDSFILEKTKHFFVIAARAPYTKDHLLIIPNKHIVLFWELVWDEVQDLMKLLQKRDKKLHKKHDDVNLLLRDWHVWWNTEKSVDHMHFHLIPDLAVSWHSDWPNRYFLTEKEVLAEVKRIKKSLK